MGNISMYLRIHMNVPKLPTSKVVMQSRFHLSVLGGEDADAAWNKEKQEIFSY